MARPGDRPVARQEPGTAPHPVGGSRSPTFSAGKSSRQRHFAAATSEFRPVEPGGSRGSKRYRLRPLAAAAALLAVASLGLTESAGVTHLGATLIRVLTPEGVLSIAVDDPNVKVSIEGERGMVITGAGPREVRLGPGSYRLSATRDGKTIKDELVTISAGANRSSPSTASPRKRPVPSKVALCSDTSGMSTRSPSAGWPPRCLLRHRRNDSALGPRNREAHQPVPPRGGGL